MHSAGSAARHRTLARRRIQATDLLSAPCSRHVSFRDLIACGETFHNLMSSPSEVPLIQPEQLPASPDTWRALPRLALHVLDPAIDEFGPIRLTYGFSGPWLCDRAGRSNAPPLDPHASHELSRAGQPICDRGGAAIDFIVPGMPTDQVALWILRTLPFDRLYCYGPDRSVHVSWHPEPKRLAFALEATPIGGLRPRRIRADTLGSDADP